MAYIETWNNFFDLYDINKDGVISKEDVRGAIDYFNDKFGVKPGSLDYLISVAAYEVFFKGFLEDADIDKDGKVTREELIATMKRIKDAGYENAPAWWRFGGTKHFEVIDKNKNGIVSLAIKELTEFVKKARPDYSEEFIRNAYEAALKLVGSDKLDAETYWHLNYVWGTTSEPRPELDVIFPYWRKA